MTGRFRSGNNPGTFVLTIRRSVFAGVTLSKRLMGILKLDINLLDAGAKSRRVADG